MNHIDLYTKVLSEGTADLWRNIAAMPEDKLTWKPADTSRSTKELLGEIVSSTVYGTAVLATKSPAHDSWKSVEVLTIQELQTAHMQANTEFLQIFAALSEEELSELVELPWGTKSYLDVVAYVYWNLMYHLGQIAYIQTMYGDGEMH